jgi:hypothetical protein
LPFWILTFILGNFIIKVDRRFFHNHVCAMESLDCRLQFGEFGGKARVTVIGLPGGEEAVV